MIRNRQYLDQTLSSGPEQVVISLYLVGSEAFVGDRGQPQMGEAFRLVGVDTSRSRFGANSMCSPGVPLI